VCVGLTFFFSLYLYVQEFRSATTAEKLRGTKVCVPTPGQRPGWVLGAGGVTPPAVRVPGKFVKTQMLNPALKCIPP